ncbi:hypothetical protein VTJ83DRAFT_1753 [Remersonia thermophila]|uniref:Dienelactone hydrolase domain-containing protein n=1 Tax=Remersonia thermophila TaxID=72144 RepID=A0ABR4DHQ8_9PEZI
MSTMPATHGHNAACCNIPPVVSSGYQPKGTYKEYDGLKTYHTGPSDATKGLVVIYDIFGYFDQTVQGADILATSHAQKYQVFIPDWFKGEPCPIELYPPKTPEQQKSLGAFFVKNPPGGVADALPGFVEKLKAQHPEIKSWGLLGYCWGGKVVALTTSRDTNPFAVGAEIHPAMVDPSEAEGIRVPLILLASKEEPAETVAKFEANLKNAPAKHVETFTDQIHGWMAARADLSDPRVKEEYARGYKVVLDFFAKNWA